MQIIAVVDQNWAIGNRGGLLYRIPGDLAHFRTLTYGGIVVYGRNTLATFPDGETLEGRTNLILTHDEKIECEAATSDYDVVFPNLDKEGWEIVYTSPPKNYNGLRYPFVTYKNPSID